MAKCLAGTEVANLNAHSDACGYPDVLCQVVEGSRRQDSPSSSN
jgi:hypothetical protein